MSQVSRETISLRLMAGRRTIEWEIVVVVESLGAVSKQLHGESFRCRWFDQWSK